MNLTKFKNDIEFALKNKYDIIVHYTEEINFINNTIIWKYPPYVVKNCISNKIIVELENYFKNSKNYLIVMYLKGNGITHKIPLNLPNTY
tara:strand:+ start:148 stop:417 length:270 start_codon:yes stop_codon:yes gene_type:complete